MCLLAINQLIVIFFDSFKYSCPIPNGALILTWSKSDQSLSSIKLNYKESNYCVKKQNWLFEAILRCTTSNNKLTIYHQLNQICIKDLNFLQPVEFHEEKHIQNIKSDKLDSEFDLIMHSTIPYKYIWSCFGVFLQA